MLKTYSKEDTIEAGCDEAGRGCIAGPVFAAAVILPKDFRNCELNDSKKLTARVRRELRAIIQAEAISYGVGMVSAGEVDRINILNASFLAMHRALDQLNALPDLLLVDGNRFKPYRNIAHSCIVRGDGIYASIAAASVLAKTYRDEYMSGLHLEFPCYHWDSNKGYPTRVHRLGLMKHGPSPYHRRTFRLLDDQMRLDFS